MLEDLESTSISPIVHKRDRTFVGGLMSQSNPNSAPIEAESDKLDLPEQIIKNIESIAKLQRQDEQTKNPQLKLLNRLAALTAEPIFLYGLLIFLALWWLMSKLHRSGLISWDIPDYQLQDQLLDTIALLVSTVILIRQTHQEQVADRQSHLMLQLDILTEQKIAKIIELLEELRSDLPNVVDRTDLEAEIMKRSTDPELVVNIIQDSLIDTDQTAKIYSPVDELTLSLLPEIK